MVTVIEKPVGLQAIFHDGTEESANAVIDFFNGKFIERFSKNERDSGKVVVEFVSLKDHGRQLVFPNWWVVYLPDHRVVSMSERAFKTDYVVYEPTDIGVHV